MGQVLLYDEIDPYVHVWPLSIAKDMTMTYRLNLVTSEHPLMLAVSSFSNNHT